MGSITYLSSDDSAMLRRASKSYSGNGVLEIGVGCGSNLLDLKAKFDLTVGTDIERTSAFIQGHTLDLVITDCASCFKPRTFDLVMMNPPYLQSVRIEDKAVDGGKGGFEIPRKFLEDATRVVKESGVILLLLSSETSVAEFSTFCKERGLDVKVVAQERLFFEELVVYEIRLSSQ